LVQVHRRYRCDTVAIFIATAGFIHIERIIDAIVVGIKTA